MGCLHGPRKKKREADGLNIALHGPAIESAVAIFSESFGSAARMKGVLRGTQAQSETILLQFRDNLAKHVSKLVLLSEKLKVEIVSITTGDGRLFALRLDFTVLSDRA